MRKEKLRKVGLFFITGCFIKHFQMIINHFFYFSGLFAEFEKWCATRASVGGVGGMLA